MRSKLFFQQILYLSPEYDASIQLRDRILRQPLQLQFTIDQLEGEYNQFHFGVYDIHQNLHACLSLNKKDSDTLQMRQVAVDSQLQNKGIGSFMVLESERWARSQGFKKIILHARDTAKPFYEKLGYQVDGAAFTELNIIHFNMYKILGEGA